MPEIEKHANTIYCPDGIGRWFYERAAGSYNVMLMREGTTSARLRQIKQSIPPSRKITKTDLAKYLNAWKQKPHIVSLGSQKNFIEFMKDFEVEDGKSPDELPNGAFYKRMIAKAILFKNTHKIVLSMFPAFHANVAAYLVALVANRIGEKLDLDKIWLQQDLSRQLKQQLNLWATGVNNILHQSASGRMISEWAKKEDCWKIVREATYSQVAADIPEVRLVKKY